jgi:hypothetical protein
MSTQRVRLELLSDCGWLLARFGRSCKGYILNDKAEQEWGEFASMEAVAELERNKVERHGSGSLSGIDDWQTKG